MNKKKSLNNHVQGWLPKEFAASKPQKPADKYTPMVRWTARALVAGVGVSAALLVLGDIAGLTQGVGGYLWYAVVAFVVWGGVAAVPFLVKHKTSPQRKPRT
ncbi:MAG: hypothetical protein NWE92_00215 [Candidatus Bathyarchaeota archaeon]|nr:hypothetical protein [Candidatus Bathyarchaeota archaeon]